jgi:hypothetical protein
VLNYGNIIWDDILPFFYKLTINQENFLIFSELSQALIEVTTAPDNAD